MINESVGELIAALRSHEMTLEDVANKFRERNWARTRSAEQVSDDRRAEQIDPGLPVPGSIDELTSAYDRGEITREQYRVLAHAVADSINAEAARAAEGGSSE